MAEIIKSVILLLAIAAVIINEIWQRKMKVAPAPTLPWVKRAMIKLLSGRLERNGSYKIAELGSGWGGLSFALAKHFPKSSVTGYDLSPVPYRFSRLRQMLSRKDVRFECRDFLDLDLEEFDIIVCYLYPGIMPALQDKFDKELKDGALVISNAFALPDWTPVEKTKTGRLPPVPVFLYKK